MAIKLPLGAHVYIDAHFAAHLERTQILLRQPSISAQHQGMRETADLLRAWLGEAGAQVELFGPSEMPILLAEWDAGAPKTLIVYGMYDVQPVDGQPWTSPPFAAEIREHPVGGPRLYARGACNSKGPLAAFLHAVESLNATSGLPVNVKWTIEGEEEIGSPSLPDFYRRHRDRLAADAVFEPFWSQPEPDGPPHIVLGTKGVLGLKFVSRAGEWGGPVAALHSSVGAWVASPAWRLVQALASMVDEHQELAVEGIPAFGTLEPGDEDLIRQHAASFDRDRVLAALRTARFKRDLEPVDLLKRLAFAPALNINGFQSGYAGPGSHTIIPNEARALADLRLPPGLRADDCIQAIRRHLDRQGFADVEMVDDGGYPAARTRLDEPVVQAMVAAYRAHGYEPIIEPVEASATPYYLFTDVLGLPFAWGGLGAAAGSHGPDEWCSVEGLRDLEKSVATFLTAYAEASGNERKQGI